MNKEPFRPRYPIYHLTASCSFVEEIRQKLENTHGTYFAAVKTPTAWIVGAPEDLKRFYPQLADQLGEKSFQE